MGLQLSGSVQLEGNLLVTGSANSVFENVLVTGTLVAQEIETQLVSSSIIYSSGSNKFGDLITDKQQFTGSINLSGSFIVGDSVNGTGRISFDRATNTTRIQSSKDGTDCVPLSFWSQATGGGFAQRMIISGSNIGLGTSNPLTDLSIYPTNSSTVGTGIRISRNTLENQQFVDINYSGGSANFTAVDTISGIGGGFTFNRSGVANDTGYSSSMEITTAGKVGIGVTPISSLSVATTSNTTDLGSTGLTIGGSTILTSGNVLMLNFTPIGAGSNRARAGIGCEVGADWGKGNLIFYTKDATGANALTTADEAMRITSSRRLGLGVTGPTQKVHIADNSSGFVGMRLSGSGDYTGTDWTLYASSDSAPSANDFFGIYNNSTTDSATEGYKLKVYKNGNVEIAATLTVQGDTTNFAGGGAYTKSNNNSVADSATISISTNPGGGGYAGFLIVSSTNTSNADVFTMTTFSVLGRGTTATFSQIQTLNGPSGGSSFTTTVPSNGSLTVTNTSGGTRTIRMLYTGHNTA